MNFLKNWQGLTALIVAILAFWLSPYALRWIDPTAGAFDPGYLQRPILAFVYLAFGHFVIWLFLQIDWPTLDEWLDGGGFTRAWKDMGHGMSNWARLYIVATVLACEMAAYIACLFAVPI